MLGPEMDEYALDMLAGADQVGFVIWAGAGILQLVQRADLHQVGTSADRFDLELAEDGMAALIGDLENLRPRPLATAFNLFLNIRWYGSTPYIRNWINGLYNVSGKFVCKSEPGQDMVLQLDHVRFFTAQVTKENYSQYFTKRLGND